MTTKKNIDHAIFVAKGEVDSPQGRDIVPVGEATKVYAHLREGRTPAGQVRTELHVTQTRYVGGGLSKRRRVIVDADAVVVGEVVTSDRKPEIVFTSRGIPVVREGKVLRGEKPGRWGAEKIPGIPGPEDLITRELAPAARAVRRSSGERI